MSRNGYAGNRKLRGRKVYLHHKNFQQSNATTSGKAEPKTKRNRTITKHVKPGTKFSTHIRFDNLTGFELGALLYLLNLPDELHHRLGMGKPLGFGSVRISADLKEAEVYDHSQIKRRYSLQKAQKVSRQTADRI